MQSPNPSTSKANLHAACPHLLDALPVMMLMLDGHGRCTATNARWQSSTGRTPADDLGEGWWESVHPEDRAALGYGLGMVRDGHTSFPLNVRMAPSLTRDCEERWFSFDTAYQSDASAWNAPGFLVAARDITERVRAERAVSDSEMRYALAAESANDGLWDWDLRRDRVYYSQRWKLLLGYDADEHLDHADAWFARIMSTDLMQLQADLAMHEAGQTNQLDNEHRIELPDGRVRWLHVRGRAWYDVHGQAIRLIGSISDITERKKAEEQLKMRAMCDALTGLANRATLVEHLNESLVKCRGPHARSLAVLFLDFDRFKVINDSLGHKVGDDLLRSIARRLTRCITVPNVAARLGGDEFAIVLHGLDAAGVCTKTRLLLHELAHPHELGKHTVTSTASIGLVTDGAAYNSVDDLLRDADTAMYHAKSNGRNQYAVFDVNMHGEAVHRLHVEHRLRQAVEREELSLLYQPIVNMKDSALQGFEALLRWHRDGEVIPPNAFIPIAEETGLIVEIGDWVLNEACRQAKAWRDRFGTERMVPINVNVSKRQLTQPGFADRCVLAVHRHGLSPQAIRLEITESVVADEGHDFRAVLRELGDRGFKLCMDDFGTGQSSLSHLHLFPIDVLKIDKSFSDNMSGHHAYPAIIQAVVTLAHNLHMSVVAEGVETEQQMGLLRNLGCDAAQGYHIARPLKVQDAEAFFSAGDEQGISIAA